MIKLLKVTLFVFLLASCSQNKSSFQAAKLPDTTGENPSGGPQPRYLIKVQEPSLDEKTYQSLLQQVKKRRKQRFEEQIDKLGIEKQGLLFFEDSLSHTYKLDQQHNTAHVQLQFRYRDNVETIEVSAPFKAEEFTYLQPNNQKDFKKFNINAIQAYCYTDPCHEVFLRITYEANGILLEKKLVLIDEAITLEPPTNPALPAPTPKPEPTTTPSDKNTTDTPTEASADTAPSASPPSLPKEAPLEPAQQKNEPAQKNQPATAQGTADNTGPNDQTPSDTSNDKSKDTADDVAHSEPPLKEEAQQNQQKTSEPPLTAENIDSAHGPYSIALDTGVAFPKTNREQEKPTLKETGEVSQPRADTPIITNDSDPLGSLLKKIKKEIYNQAKGHYSNGSLNKGTLVPTVKDIGLIKWTAMSQTANYSSGITINTLKYAMTKLREDFPKSFLYINNASEEKGGQIRGTSHKSHQNGLDVDVQFIASKPSQIHCLKKHALKESTKGCEDFHSVFNRNWNFLKYLTETNRVSVVFSDKKIMSFLCKNSKRIDKEERQKVLGLLYHIPGHQTFFHIRMKCRAEQNEGCRGQEHSVRSKMINPSTCKFGS